MSQNKTMRSFFMMRPGHWIPLWEILALGIAQYNARIKELRDEGMWIQSKVTTLNGAKHSFFRYDPAGQKELF